MDDTGHNKEGLDGFEKNANENKSNHPPLSNSSNPSNTPTPGNNPPPIGNIPEPPPKNWLIESILATIFCCWPIGIVGIINAAKVESKWNQGDKEGARHAAKEAAKWTKLCVGLGFVFIVLYIAFAVIMGVVGASQGY